MCIISQHYVALSRSFLILFYYATHYVIRWSIFFCKRNSLWTIKHLHAATWRHWCLNDWWVSSVCAGEKLRSHTEHAGKHSQSETVSSNMYQWQQDTKQAQMWRVEGFHTGPWQTRRTTGTKKYNGLPYYIWRPSRAKGLETQLVRRDRAAEDRQQLTSLCQ